MNPDHVRVARLGHQTRSRGLTCVRMASSGSGAKRVRVDHSARQLRPAGRTRAPNAFEWTNWCVSRVRPNRVGYQTRPPTALARQIFLQCVIVVVPFAMSERKVFVSQTALRARQLCLPSSCGVLTGDAQGLHEATPWAHIFFVDALQLSPGQS